MPDINGIPYVESTDLVSAYPAVSLALAQELDDQLASKADYPTGGADGNVLTKSGTDTAWTGAGSVGGLVLIDSESFSAVSSVSVDNCFTSTYDNYRIIIYGTASTDIKLAFRMRASGSDATGSNYDLQILSYADTTLSGGRQTGGSEAEFGRINTATASLHVDICNPALANVTTWTSHNAYNGNSVVRNVYGRHTLTTAYDGFSIFVGSGTITGNLRVYGYRN